MFQREVLQAKKMHEIRSMLVDKGASWSAKEKKVDLINRFIEITATVQPNERLHKKEKTKEEVIYPTVDEILEAVRPLRDEGLNVSFTEDGTSWAFTAKKGSRTREDTGTTKQPLFVIKRCAEILVRA